MSKTKKKKPKACSAKQEEAARFNTYFKNLKEVLDLWNCGQVLALLDEIERHCFYDLHIQPIQIGGNPSPILSKTDLNDIGSFLQQFCNQAQLKLEPVNRLFSLKQYTGILHEVLRLKKMADLGMLKQSKAICELMEPTLEIELLRTMAENHLRSITQLVESLFSSPTKRAILIRSDINNPVKGKGSRLGLKLSIDAMQVQVTDFNVDGHKRPGFRLASSGYDLNGPWISVNRALFENVPYDDGLKLPVYIQNHTLQRLAERLDLIDNRFFQMFLNFNLDRPTVIRYKNYHLIEFKLWHFKVGYLVADVIRNKLLLKTFLFLPSDGTPEGEKLRKLSGLSKVDMHYWNIDRLSTFYHSDLRDNPRLKQLFCDAGCGDLFKVDIDKNLENQSHWQLAKQLCLYLKTPGTKEEELEKLHQAELKEMVVAVEVESPGTQAGQVFS